MLSLSASSPIKSTSFAYCSDSRGRLAGLMGGLGRSTPTRRCISAPARVRVKRTPDCESPCNEPDRLMNSVDEDLPTRTCSFVFDGGKRTGLISSSVQPASSNRLSTVFRLMVSNAELMSIPIL